MCNPAREIAAAVVSALNDETFSQTFTAERAYLPVHDLEELTDLHVIVIPATAAWEAIDRQHTEDTYQVDVAIQKRIDPSIIAQADALYDLLEEIAAFCRTSRRLGDYPTGILTKQETLSGAQAGYAPQHLDQFRCFTAVLRLTYLLIR